MPSLIDIRRRIRAVKSTQQITKAMKMVAASRMRRAYERIVNARPFSQQMLRVLRPGGLFISAEGYWIRGAWLPLAVMRYRADRPKDVVFWEPNPRAWRRMLWTAGFEDVREHGRFRLKARAGWSVPHVVHHAYRR